MPSSHKASFNGTVDNDFLSFKMWNIGATTVSEGDVVVFYNHLAGGGTGNHSVMWCRAVTAGWNVPGVDAYQALSQRKVAGVVRDATIDGGSSGIICFHGYVSCNVTGTVAAGDHLLLSTSVGLARALGTLSGALLSEGKLFGYAIGTNSGTEKKIKAFVHPWRF